MKKCNICGKELLDDSVFCQYCGSKDVVFVNDIIKQFKRCIDCGKVLPMDSDFCQYCGSKRVAIVGGASLKNKTKNNSFDGRKLKEVKPFYFALVIVALSLLGIYILENSSNGFVNGQIVVQNEYFKTGETLFYVNAPEKENVYVYITTRTTKKSFSYLVEKNETVSVYLKSGTYDVYYAVGKHWYGPLLKFGVGTKYYVDKEMLVVSSFNGGCWVTTFEPLDNTIYKIGASEFPG